MVQWVQCRHGVLCSEKNSCRRMKTNIFTRGRRCHFSCLPSAAWTDDQNWKGRCVEVYREANRRASGCRRQAEGWLEYIVTLMRLSDSLWWSGCVFVPARLTLLNAHAVNPCWTLASHAKLRGWKHMSCFCMQSVVLMYTFQYFLYSLLGKCSLVFVFFVNKDYQ